MQKGWKKMGRSIDADALAELLKREAEHHEADGLLERSYGVLDAYMDVLQAPTVYPEQPKMGKWIPCSESLPGEKDSIFAGLYGTPKWNKSMFRKRSQRVLVTVVYPNGKRGVDVNHTTDGEWYKDPLSKAWDVKTVAWMPFPEPYKEEEDGTVD